MTKNGIYSTDCFDSRKKRREAVKIIHECLAKIRAAEQNYLDNVPDNLQNSGSFDVGDCAVDVLDEVIGLLADAY